MADMYADIPELSAETLAVMRRQKIADAMQAQSFKPLETNRMAGGFVQRVSPLEGLAKIFQAYAAKSGLEKSDEEMKGLSEKRQRIIDTEMERINQMRTGTPAQAAISLPDDQFGPVAPAVSAVAPASRQQITQAMMQSKYAPLQAMGMQSMHKENDAAIEAEQFQSALKAAGYGAQPAAPAKPAFNPQTGLTPEQEAYAAKLTGSDQQAFVNAQRATNQGQAASFAVDDPNTNQVASLNLPQAPAQPAAATAAPTSPPVNPLLLSPNSKVAAVGKVMQALMDKKELQATALADKKDARDQSEQLRRDLADSRKAESGKAPPGYRYKPDGSMEPIPGGPADTKIQGALNKDTQALTASESNLDRLAMEANKLLNHAGLDGITGLRGSIPNIPGSPAADAQATLGALKSQIGFGVLQNMRDNSKTGGALGSVSDAEGKRLEANLAALDNSQSIDQFKANLKQVLKYVDTAKTNLRNAYNIRHGDKSVEPKLDAPRPAPTPYVETRKTADGRVLGKKADGTIEEVK
jgi:hypothetical protein